MSALRAPTAAGGRGAVTAFAPIALLLLSACATSAPPQEPVKVPPMSKPYPPKRVDAPPAEPADRDERGQSADDDGQALP